ncbi:MAG TPA: DNA methyltransferase, partial [Candidatus Kapabacteria bacterium]|nr:DNA methyltransferase [Candidatus Kapabacteria bacterium]
MKQLYFGDCLDVLKELYEKHPEGLIDLIYIDPPFNSKRNYNILFEDIDMKDVKAQREAFADTWSNVSYKDGLREIADLNINLYHFLKNLDNIDISKSTVAYLTTIAHRLFYMHKLLNNTGSFYLHCDPTMSHYLKIVCDIIFNKDNFRNEIVWKRTFSHNDPKRFGRITDRILYYNKSNEFTFNVNYLDYSEQYLNNFFKYKDKKGIYRLVVLTGPGINENDPEWMKYHPKQSKRSWSVPKRILNSLVDEEKLKLMTTSEKLDLLNEKGYIHFSKNGVPSFKQYLDDMKGAPLQELWDNLPPISAQAKERLGYPTQKPEALLERIIQTSSNEGDVVADFFCGCGTTVSVANRLNRNWLGVDISHLAIKLILKRLTDPLEEEAKKIFLNSTTINGFPKDIASAKELAIKDKKGRIDFQEWVVEFLLGGILNPKKTADGGWDGYLTFPKNNNEKGIVLIEVKSGNVSVKNIREFINVIDRQNADIGVFVCFAENLTKPMLEAAKEAGNYTNYKFDRIQILTIEDIFENKMFKLPG